MDHSSKLPAQLIFIIIIIMVLYILTSVGQS